MYYTHALLSLSKLTSLVADALQSVGSSKAKRYLLGFVDSRMVMIIIPLRRLHATISTDEKKYQCFGKMWKHTKALVILE